MSEQLTRGVEVDQGHAAKTVPELEQPDDPLVNCSVTVRESWLMALDYYILSERKKGRKGLSRSEIVRGLLAEYFDREGIKPT